MPYLIQRVSKDNCCWEMYWFVSQKPEDAWGIAIGVSSKWLHFRIRMEIYYFSLAATKLHLKLLTLKKQLKTTYLETILWYPNKWALKGLSSGGTEEICSVPACTELWLVKVQPSHNVRGVLLLLLLHWQLCFVLTKSQSPFINLHQCNLHHGTAQKRQILPEDFLWHTCASLTCCSAWGGSRAGSCQIAWFLPTCVLTSAICGMHQITLAGKFKLQNVSNLQSTNIQLSTHYLNCNCCPFACTTVSAEAATCAEPAPQPYHKQVNGRFQQQEPAQLCTTIRTVLL